MHRPQPTFQVNGAAIRTIRMQQGVEISELAEKAGITPSYLSRLEVGTATGRMRPGRYAALRTALGLPPDDTQLLAPSPHEEPHEKR